MKTTLVGYTGFVGGNLAACHGFDGLYNSKNIGEAFGADNGLVVYSGMPAEKFLADADPAADLAVAQNAFQNIQRMKPERLVLISTVDVYPDPRGVYEDTPAGGESATPYGANRLQLENWVREAYPEALILRLPGLYGKGLKKNFVFDMFTLVPPMLREDKFTALCAQEALVAECYKPDDNGFYRLDKTLPPDKRAALKAFFEGNDFNSLCFTDSRSVFQFYDLSRLWGDINRCLQKQLRLVNLATAPVRAADLYSHLFGKEFTNELAKPPFYYDMRTRYGREFGGGDEYIADVGEVLAGIGRLGAAGF